jgi:hypothetical protein
MTWVVPARIPQVSRLWGWKQGVRQGCLVAVAVVVPLAVYAQEPVAPAASEIARQVVLDPTTYLPAILGYVSTQLDWDTSQAFFAHGMREHNAGFTISGRADDVPIGYAAGNRKIVRQSLLLIPASLGNNAASAVMERMLRRQLPNHSKIVRAIGRLERLTFAAYLSYRESSRHFRQWRWNQQQTAQLGFR